MATRLLAIGETTGHLFDSLRVLVARDFRARYKGSTLGIAWALLSPLGTAIVLQFVFTAILKTGQPNFGLFIYCGMLPWTWFQMSVQAGSSTLVENRDLVRTPFFSKPLLPWMVVCTNFVLYLLSLPVLFALMAYEGLPITGMVLLLPVVWAVQWVLCVALALLMAAIGILIRDWQHVLSLVLLFWFYLTPIFYSPEQLPTGMAGWLAWNPMTAVVMSHRAILLHAQQPDWAALALVLAGSIVLLVVSLLAFRALEDSFIDQI